MATTFREQSMYNLFKMMDYTFCEIQNKDALTKLLENLGTFDDLGNVTHIDGMPVNAECIYIGPKSIQITGNCITIFKPTA